MKNKIVELMIGIPGSGKSTLANKLASQFNAVILSSDGIREELVNKNKVSHEYNKNTNAFVFNELKNRYTNNLIQGNHIILDATNLERRHRLNYINEAKQYGYYVRARFIIIPKSLAVERVILRQTKNPNVFNRMDEPQLIVNKFYKTLKANYPHIGEGFDELIKYKTENGDFVIVNEIKGNE